MFKIKSIKKPSIPSTWKKYFFEFLSIFFAVTFAFILNRWNEDRKDSLSENKILTEIYNGLKRDSLDLAYDEQTLEINIKAAKYFRKIIDKKTVETDSIGIYYFFLTRDYITVQNTSGYETLKSKGLEIIQNDSLRHKIINLYEVTYKLHKKFTEEYDENKYMKSYFEAINKYIGPNLTYDKSGNIVGIQQPIDISVSEQNLAKSYLWKLEVNRKDRLRAMKSNQERIGKVRRNIEMYLK